jgi:hypothetical protein
MDHTEIVNQAKHLAAVHAACGFHGLMAWYVRDGAIEPMLRVPLTWADPRRQWDDAISACPQRQRAGDVAVFVQVARIENGRAQITVAVGSPDVSTTLLADAVDGRIVEWTDDTQAIDTRETVRPGSEAVVHG